MSNKKDEAISVMQEYFPNGGRDWDAICELYDAIKQGKIPHVQITQNESRAEMIEYIQQAIREGYNSYYGLSENGITWLSDECLKIDYGLAWEYYNLAVDENGKYPNRDLGE